MFDTIVNLLKESKIFNNKYTKFIIYLLVFLMFLYIFIVFAGTIFSFNILNYDHIEKSWSLLTATIWIIFLVFLFLTSVDWAWKIEKDRIKIIEELNNVSKNHEELLSNTNWKVVKINPNKDSWTFKTIARLDNSIHKELRVWLDKKLFGEDFWKLYIYYKSFQGKLSNDFEVSKSDEEVFNYVKNDWNYDESIVNIFNQLNKLK